MNKKPKVENAEKPAAKPKICIIKSNYRNIYVFIAAFLLIFCMKSIILTKKLAN